MAAALRAQAPAATAIEVVVATSEAPRIIAQLGAKRFGGGTLEQHVLDDPSVIRTWAGSRASSADAGERRAYGRILIGLLDGGAIVGLEPTVAPAPQAALAPAPPVRPSPLAGSPVESVRRRAAAVRVNAYTSVSTYRRVYACLHYAWIAAPILVTVVLMSLGCLLLYRPELLVVLPIKITTLLQVFVSYLLGRAYTRIESEISFALFGVRSSEPASAQAVAIPAYLPPAASQIPMLGWVLAACAYIRQQ